MFGDCKDRLLCWIGSHQSDSWGANHEFPSNTIGFQHHPYHITMIHDIYIYVNYTLHFGRLDTILITSTMHDTSLNFHLPQGLASWRMSWSQSCQRRSLGLTAVMVWFYTRDSCYHCMLQLIIQLATWTFEFKFTKIINRYFVNFVNGIKQNIIWTWLVLTSHDNVLVILQFLWILLLPSGSDFRLSWPRLECFRKEDGQTPRASPTRQRMCTAWIWSFAWHHVDTSVDWLILRYVDWLVGWLVNDCC